MSGVTSSDQAFINRLTGIILANLENEHFGVDELAKSSGMPRSHIHQRLLTLLAKPTIQFIREVRLARALELLQQENITASEVAYRTGFGSPAYFNTCFHEFYGYPPGKVLRHSLGETESESNSHNEQLLDLTPEPSMKSGKHTVWNISGRILFIYSCIGLLIIFGLVLLLNIAVFKNKNTAPSDLIKNEEKSIAVLPFKNLSNDPDNQGIVDGIMEDIVSHLYIVRELRVISRTSVEQFRNSTNTIPEIAKKLGVNFILEGSVLQYGGKIRVMVQLIDARNEQCILTEQYDRDFEDIFIIQSTIAKLVAKELQTVLTLKEIEKIEKKPTQNKEAYKYYLMGRSLCNKKIGERPFNDPDLLKSRECFEKSISIDPDYPLAYAGLADALYTLTWWRTLPRTEGYELAKKNALRALELDKNLSEAHTVLGRIYTFGEWKWEKARDEFLQAIELNPNYPFAHANYSELLDILGEDDAARKEINLALNFDPTMVYFYRLSAAYYFNQGKLNESLKELDKMVEFFPGPWIYDLWQRFYIYDRLNDDSHALGILKELMANDSSIIKYLPMVDPVYQKSGMNGIYSKMAEVLSHETNASPLSIAQLYARLGKKEESIAWLRKALEERNGRLPNLNNDPRCVNIRQEPGFREIIGQLGLSPYFNPAKDFSPVAD